MWSSVAKTKLDGYAFLPKMPRRRLCRTANAAVPHAIDECTARLQSRHAVKRGGFLTVKEPLQVFSYGHCGKKFAAKVPGDGIQLPAPGADTETFV
jgi:hypothetical protein